MHKKSAPSTKGGETVSSSSASGGQHSYSVEEVRSFSDFINQLLASDEDLKNVLPLVKDDLFKACAQSVLLCKLINAIKPGTIDERKIVVKPDMSMYEKIQNHDLAIRGARDLGCEIVNIGGMDLLEEKPYLLLGIIWQIVERGLMSKMSLDAHPELISMIDAKEDLSAFAHAAPVQNLLRWFNYHLAKAGSGKHIANFGADISSGDAYLELLSQLCPSVVSKNALVDLQGSSAQSKAEAVCEFARKMDALRFVTASDIVAGNPKLNLAFTAYLFHRYPGLEVLSGGESEAKNRDRLEEVARVMRAKYAEDDEARAKRWAEEERERRERWRVEEEERAARALEASAERKRRWEAEEAEMRERLNDEERRKREDMLRAEAELRARQASAEAQAREQAESRRRAEASAEEARALEAERRRRWDAQVQWYADQKSAQQEEALRRSAWEAEQRQRAEERTRLAQEQEQKRRAAWDEYNRKQAEIQENIRKQAWAQYHYLQRREAEHKSREEALEMQIDQQNQALMVLTSRTTTTSGPSPNRSIASSSTTTTTTTTPHHRHHAHRIGATGGPTVTEITTVTKSPATALSPARIGPTDNNPTTLWPIPKVHITVCRARALIPTGVILMPDPYAFVYRGSDRMRTPHVTSSKDPVWNTTFEFKSVSEFDEIVVNICDRNLIGKDKFMGQVVLTKADFEWLGQRWFRLKSRTYKSDSVHGEVLVDIGAVFF